MNANAKTGNEIKVFWDQEAHRGRGMWAAEVNGKRVKCPAIPNDPTVSDYEAAIETLAHCHDVPEPAEGWAGSVAVDGLSAQYIAIDD